MMCPLRLSFFVCLPLAALSESSACAAGSDACEAEVVDGFATLQIKAKSLTSTCEGPWCTTVEAFYQKFDTNDPATMQAAFDEYSEWQSPEEGLKIAVTKDHYYEMYHENVEKKLAEYLPQGFFAWSFGGPITAMGDASSAAEAGTKKVTVVRDGSVTFELGWMRRQWFWKYVLKTLPLGETFPFSTVEEFDDCTDCPAKILLELRDGGLSGNEGTGWKITGVAILKLG